MYKKPGQMAGAGQNVHVCDFETELPEGKVCDVDLNSLTPCISENHYNYHKKAPCIFLKLNKVQNCKIVTQLKK